MTKFNWWKGLSSAQTSFLDAIYNGLYSCSVNMRRNRLSLV